MVTMTSRARWAAPSFDDARSGAALLDSGEVHVWCATLEPGEEAVARLRGVLDEDECRRADRFTFEAGRRQYTVGRGLLRVILGHYLAVEPTALRFRYNPYGKPELAPGLECGTLKFNLSHSGALVLYAVSRAREVGIDVETIRPEFATEGIAERFFAAGERATLRDLPPESRTHAFFTCWTRKEAFIKARGQGLSIPLDAFEVSLVPGAPPAILATHDDPEEAGRWSLHELSPGAGYVAAVAVAGGGHRIRYGTWPFS
jgi:4'-phosphopantetheinyl transferase